MRHLHGDEPRNPYNMIIQENHAATRVTSIVTYFYSNQQFLVENAVILLNNGENSHRSDDMARPTE